MVRHNLHPRIQLWNPGAALTAAGLGDEVNAVADRVMPRCVVVDLRHAQQADVDGVVWLVNLQLACREQGSRLFLLAPAPAVRSVLREARVENRFRRMESFGELRELVTAVESPSGWTRISAER